MGKLKKLSFYQRNRCKRQSVIYLSAAQPMSFCLQSLSQPRSAAIGVIAN